jgi:hypothetical protein
MQPHTVPVRGTPTGETHGNPTYPAKLTDFDQLPDSSPVDVKVLSGVFDCSVNTAWRQYGHLAIKVFLGRWTDFSAPRAPSPTRCLDPRFLHLDRRSCRPLARFDGGPITTEVTYQFFPQVFLDQRFMNPFGQTLLGKFFEDSLERGFRR